MKAGYRADGLRRDGYEKFEVKPDFLASCHFSEYMFGCPAHWHEHIEFLHVCRGEIRLFVQGNPVTAREGELLVINSGQIHAIPQKHADSRYECLIPHKELCERMGIAPEKVKLPNLIQDEKYHHMCHHIMQELKEKKPFYKTSVQLHLLSLLVGLMQDYGEEGGEEKTTVSGREAVVQRAIGFIGENYKKAISTADVCRAIGFDESYVCHSFKEITGSTILEHLNMVRCEKARGLLLSGKCSVTECAGQCGFGHLSYFSRTYKRYMGELPGETAGKRADRKE